MLPIYEDNRKRIIQVREEINFSSSTGFHLLILTVRAKGEKHATNTRSTRANDEILSVRIDNKSFPQRGSKKLVNSPATFNGHKLRNLSKTVFFLVSFEGNDHKIYFDVNNPPGTATFESLKVYKLDLTENLTLEPKIQAEDGDRRDWVTFVLDNISLSTFTASFNLKRRFIDSDDVKVIVDGIIKRNNRSLFHKLWYFTASLFTNEIQTETFNINLSAGLHYIEFWADRIPTFNSITFSHLTGQLTEETLQDKIRRKAKEYEFDPELILRLVERESSFNPNAISPMGAKGLFQLTDITVEQIANLGLKIDNPFDIDQNIQGGMIYLKWLYEMYGNQEDQIEKTLAAWNYGLKHIPTNGPLDFQTLPKETKEFIKFILQKNEI